MENASKALIIAGAILLAILIIGLGIFIYGQAAGTASDAGMDALSASAYNAQFESYIRTGVSGTNAMKLFDAVVSNLSTNSKEVKMQTKEGTKSPVNLGITKSGKIDQATINTSRENLRRLSNKFDIEATRDTNGYIVSILFKYTK